ncbi:hypothetical protein HID58_074640, partial [Brassica napus]
LLEKISESGNFVAANSESIISSSSTEHGVRCDYNLTANSRNDKSEECEPLKRAVLVLTERSSVLRNVLVASSVGFVVVLGGIIGLNFKF